VETIWLWKQFCEMPTLNKPGIVLSGTCFLTCPSIFIDPCTDILWNSAHDDKPDKQFELSILFHTKTLPYFRTQCINILSRMSSIILTSGILELVARTKSVNPHRK